MMLEQTKQTGQHKIRSRRIALYPGAFRPPHKGHLTVVLNLASRSDVDEVIVIISNRCRTIPGTTKVLDTDIARLIWPIYLQRLPNVRIEVAPHTAVHHALSYFDRVDVGDTLLFCIGEADLTRGDDRFTNLSNFTGRTGVLAELIAVPSSFRSTTLRTMLANGATGQAPFMAALPAPLNEEQREKVWTICCEGMREMSELILEKVRAVINLNNLGEISKLEPVQKGKIDPVFRVRFKDGRCHFIKYAGDTIESGCFGQKRTQKPRRRLSTEHRTLKRLRDHKLDDGVDLPEVVLFDKKTLTLVLTEVCPGGRSLLGDLKHGHFDLSVAASVSSFLSACHTLSSSINPVWGDHETDLAHWREILDLRTTGIKSPVFPEQIRRHLEALKTLGAKASQKRVHPQLLLLNDIPKNILLVKERIGVIDFECCSSIGDPACDFGLVLGHYIFWGLVTASESACGKAIETGLKAYQERLGEEWFSLRSRVVAFSGAAILDQITQEEHILPQHTQQELMKTAIALLSLGLCRDGEIDEVMIRAASGKLGGEV